MDRTDNPPTVNPYEPSQVTKPAGDTGEMEMLPAGTEVASAYTIAARVLKMRWMTLVVIYLLVSAPLDWLIAYLGRDMETWEEFRVYFRMQQAAEFWIGSIVSGALVVATLATLDRRPISVLFCYGKSLHRYGKLLTTYFIFNLLFLLGLILLVVPGILFAVRGVLAVSIAVNENVHGPTAIRRSYELTEGRIGEAAGYLSAIVAVHVMALGTFMAIAVGVAIFEELYPDVMVISVDSYWFDYVLGFLFVIPAVWSPVLSTAAYRRLVELQRNG